MRTTFQMELGRIKNPGAQAAYWGNHTVDDRWVRTYVASRTFMQMNPIPVVTQQRYQKYHRFLRPIFVLNHYRLASVG